nr:MAG TPA: hypothetical protein [Caudoviricetes sp.]
MSIHFFIFYLFLSIIFSSLYIIDSNKAISILTEI